MSREFIKKYLAICGLFVSLLFVSMPRTGLYGDLQFWITWSGFDAEHGLGHAYESGTDYLPLYHYVLYAYGKIQGSAHNIQHNIHYLKMVTLCFHLLTGFFLIRLIKRKEENWNDAIFRGLFYLFNLAILYNSLIWGQVDGIMACLVFLSFYHAYKKKVLVSILLFVLAINFKLQSIIFMPFLGLMLIPEWVRQFSWKNLSLWVIAPILLEVIILAPFIATNSVGSVWGVAFHSVDKYPFISMNAYNLWDFFIDGKLREIKDNLTFGGITYKKWGLLLFCSTSFLALFPLLKAAIAQLKSKTAESLSLDKLLLIGAILPLIFFYFNTQMHERYSHPAFVFLITYCLVKNKPLLGVLGCLAYFLNLEGVLHFLRLENYHTLIFNRDFISFLFLTTIVWLFVELYRKPKSIESLAHEVAAHSE